MNDSAIGDANGHAAEPKRKISNRKRRGRGEGSVYLRSDGQWVGTVSFGYDGAGRRQRRTVYGKSKAEALEKLRAVANKGADSLKDADKMTVGPFLTTWLETRVRPSVADTTHDRYAMLVRLQITPHLGTLPLSRLRATHVEHMLAKLKEDGAGDRTRLMTVAVLGTACRWAVKKKLIAHNPIADVERPRVERKPMKVWDGEQCRAFLATAATDRLYALYVVALTTGLRQGELLGLSWLDVDFANGILSVSRQLRELRGKVYLGELKTESSRRAIALPKIALDALHEHRKAALAAGRDVKDGTIFLAHNGELMHKSNFLRYDFFPLMKRSDLPRIRFHDLRHSAATLLLAQGENPKVVQERLGHSKIEMTLNTYAHVNHGMQKAAAAKLDQMFG